RQLGYTPACSSYFAKGSQMIGVSSRANAPFAGSSAEHTHRRIAVRLLPFVFLLYIINYLDRTSVAYAALGMARDLGFDDRVLGLGIGIFFLSYLPLQIPGAVLAGRWRARLLLRDYDRVGIANRAHRSRAHSCTTLCRALIIRCGGSRFLSSGYRL